MKIVHEVGHTLAALACGAHVRDIRIGPGIQIYPRLARAPCRAFTIHYSQPKTVWQRGFVAFMGTGSTTIAAYVLLLLAWRLGLPAWGRLSLAVAALPCAWEMLLYSTLPRLGLRHFVAFGGQHTEPVDGMKLMGVPMAGYALFLALSLVGFHIAFFSIARIRHA
jgi:hypothetical protein